ncbi:hypothetical protein XENOCAPTIV_027579 [Xenoophorus captivus]|uniref:Uncharacterized protein n=1 Tax=Xenoophorus captivus TaxID=1517983 RepID=A0ABV0QVK1_9TELE
MRCQIKCRRDQIYLWLSGTFTLPSLLLPVFSLTYRKYNISCLDTFIVTNKHGNHGGEIKGIPPITPIKVTSFRKLARDEQHVYYTAKSSLLYSQWYSNKWWKTYYNLRNKHLKTKFDERLLLRSVHHN